MCTSKFRKMVWVSKNIRLVIKFVEWVEKGFWPCDAMRPIKKENFHSSYSELTLFSFLENLIIPYIYPHTHLRPFSSHFYNEIQDGTHFDVFYWFNKIFAIKLQIPTFKVNLTKILFIFNDLLRSFYFYFLHIFFLALFSQF